MNNSNNELLIAQLHAHVELQTNDFESFEMHLLSTNAQRMHSQAWQDDLNEHICQ